MSTYYQQFPHYDPYILTPLEFEPDDEFDLDDAYPWELEVPTDPDEPTTHTVHFSFGALANYPCPEPELRRWSGQDLIRHANSFEDSARKSRRVSDWASHDHCIIRISQLDAELKRRGLSHRHDYAHLTIGPRS